MLDTDREVGTNKTCWTLMVNKDGKDMLDTADEMKTKKTFWNRMVR